MNATLPRCVPDALVTMKSAALEALNGEIQQLVLSSYKIRARVKLHSKLNKASTIVQWFVRYAKVFSGRELGTLPLDPTTQKTLKPPMSVVLQLMEDARQNKILGT
jgi:hypothetical protein